jgi:hypothetical protein
VLEEDVEQAFAVAHGMGFKLGIRTEMIEDDSGCV